MKKQIDLKLVLIVAGVVVALILLVVGGFVSTQNKAIGYEEQIYESQASVNVQEKRRVDLVYNLVDVAEQYAAHEREVFAEVTQARNEANSGDYEQAALALHAVAEAYPELKSNENYAQLMTELSVTENMIAQYRENYNLQVRNYNKFVRKFPNSFVLGVMGYEVVEFTYTEYDAPQDAPQNLFD